MVWTKVSVLASVAIYCFVAANMTFDQIVETSKEQEDVVRQFFESKNEKVEKLHREGNIFNIVTDKDSYYIEAGEELVIYKKDETLKIK